MSGGYEFDQVWADIAREQEGILARRQLLAAGLTAGRARREIVARRWCQLYAGVYATFTCAVSDRAWVWAAVLRAGPGAVASHRTALWLAGVIDERPEVLEIAISHDRRANVGPGLRIHRMRHLPQLTHPAGRPPRLRLEAATLAVTENAESAETVIDLVFRATQRRLTTAARLRVALKAWPRHRWRALLIDLLANVDDGVASALELRYLRDVERAHRLPRGERNRPEAGPDGRSRRYRDVRYPLQHLVVELDGRGAHPDVEAFRDLRRDNDSVVGGDSVLRFGWRDVASRPCQAASQVAQVLERNGWPGHPTHCRPTCPLRA